MDIRKGKEKPLYCLLANNGFKEISFLMISNLSTAKPTKNTLILYAKMGSIKDRNGMDLTEAEDIQKRW